MLFNSLEFLLVFLPLVFAGFLLLLRLGRNPVLWLTVSSLVFYAWWEPRYLVLILGSASVNYSLARWLATLPQGVWRRRLFALAIVLNLLLLGYYKYTAMLVETVALLFDIPLQAPHIVLPLAISFFTLQQIAYQVDVYRGQKVETNPLNYLVFVSFFPQLIAGPIVHHKQLVPQTMRLRERYDPALLGPGLSMIILGLCKKVVVADSLALFAIPGFDAVAAGALTSLDALLSVSAYTLQIYFDFSGYCDIAIGLALLFGVRLPVNFDSPYKSITVAEYWRRWHITLSTFFRDYVYIPLGGNRAGKSSKLRNLAITMLVSGLWHGADWNFLIWGGVHGLFLVVHSLWDEFARARSLPRDVVAWSIVSQCLTFVAVTLAFVLFRTTSLEAAGHIYSSILSFDLSFGRAYLSALEASLQFDVLGLVAASLGVANTGILFVCCTLLIVFLAPNALDYCNNDKVGLEREAELVGHRGPAQALRNSLLWWPLMALALWASLVSLTSVSPFLYFQF